MSAQPAQFGGQISEQIRAQIRGWCPGALTPMQTGDGWLVRVRPRSGTYSLAQLQAIAQAAWEHGNGEIDLTNRANLQIRGLSPISIPAAQALLAGAGLIDGSAASEAVRNVILAPLAGLDPQAVDIRPLARTLEAALIADKRFHSLPGKFGFAICGGGGFALAAGLADITVRTSDKTLTVELAGAHQSSPGKGEDALARCIASLRDDAGDEGLATSSDARSGLSPSPAHRASSPFRGEESDVAPALSLADAFLDAALGDPSIRRMRDLVKKVGAAAVFQTAGLDIEVPQQTKASLVPIGPLGPPDVPYALGIGLPYGRISAPALFKLIAVARDCGITEFRPSPGRIFIVPLASQHAAPMTAAATGLDLITTPNDPRLAMDVCPGAPACNRGTTRTREDAERLASVLPRSGGSIHISGCSKGCARQGAARLTLVARDGLYDIIANGSVFDTPIRTGIAPSELAPALASLSGGQRG